MCVSVTLRTGTMCELLAGVEFFVTDQRQPARQVVASRTRRDTVEQWTKGANNAVKWTRLSCRDFVDNLLRLQLFTLACILGSFSRRLALPRVLKHWLLTALREILLKIGAKVVMHACGVNPRVAEVVIQRRLLAATVERVQGPCRSDLAVVQSR